MIQFQKCVLLLLCIQVLASCNTSIELTKRRYSSGYHVEVKSKHKNKSTFSSMAKPVDSNKAINSSSLSSANPAILTPQQHNEIQNNRVRSVKTNTITAKATKLEKQQKKFERKATFVKRIIDRKKSSSSSSSSLITILLVAALLIIASAIIINNVILSPVEIFLIFFILAFLLSALLALFLNTNGGNSSGISNLLGTYFAFSGLSTLVTIIVILLGL